MRATSLPTALPIAIAAVALVAAVLAPLAVPCSALAERWLRPVSGEVARSFSYARAAPFVRGAHRGVDLAAPPGTAVRAACAGRVVYAGPVPGSDEVVSMALRRAPRQLPAAGDCRGAGRRDDQGGNRARHGRARPRRPPRRRPASGRPVRLRGPDAAADAQPCAAAGGVPDHASTTVDPAARRTGATARAPDAPSPAAAEGAVASPGPVIPARRSLAAVERAVRSPGSVIPARRSLAAVERAVRSPGSVISAGASLAAVERAVRSPGSVISAGASLAA